MAATKINYIDPKFPLIEEHKGIHFPNEESYMYFRNTLFVWKIIHITIRIKCILKRDYHLFQSADILSANLDWIKFCNNEVRSFNIFTRKVERYETLYKYDLFFWITDNTFLLKSIRSYGRRLIAQEWRYKNKNNRFIKALKCV